MSKKIFFFVLCLIITFGASCGKRQKSTEYPPASQSLVTPSPMEATPASEISEEQGNSETTPSAAAEALPSATQPAVLTPTPTEIPAVCEAEVESFEISKDNEHISSALDYSVDNQNCVISATIGYGSYVDIITLKNCKINVSVRNGKCLIDSGALNPDGTVDLMKLTEITVVDGKNVKKSYKVETKRTVYDLPIVNIFLDGMKSVDSIDRYEYSSMTFYIDASGADEFESTGIISGKIRGRGHSSWKWDKKPYKIKFNESASVLGLAKNKDWVLLANYSDKSLIRNTVAYQMSRYLNGMDWNPTQYPVDLFVNGEYRGVYSIGEQIEVSENRVNIEKNGTEANTGYLLEVGGTEEEATVDKDFFRTDSRMVNFIAFKSPDSNEITDEQKQFLKDYFNKTEEAIVQGENYEEYIDVDSFCDWIIIHELTYNLDCCYRRSCYFNMDKDGKLKMGPVWDFDLAFGNCNRDNTKYNDWATVGDDAEDVILWKIKALGAVCMTDGLRSGTDCLRKP